MGISKGTPKSLDQAIINALEMECGANYDPALVPVIRAQVKDFLAQRFGVLTDELEVVWNKIFPESKGG